MFASVCGGVADMERVIECCVAFSSNVVNVSPSWLPCSSTSSKDGTVYRHKEISFNILSTSYLILHTWYSHTLIVLDALGCTWGDSIIHTSIKFENFEFDLRVNKSTRDVLLHSWRWGCGDTNPVEGFVFHLHPAHKEWRSSKEWLADNLHLISLIHSSVI